MTPQVVEIIVGVGIQQLFKKIKCWSLPLVKFKYVFVFIGVPSFFSSKIINRTKSEVGNLIMM